MARIDAATAGGRNALAFMNTLAVSEHTFVRLAKSDSGYDVIVAGTPQRPPLLTSYQEMNTPASLLAAYRRAGGVAAS